MKKILILNALLSVFYVELAHSVNIADIDGKVSRVERRMIALEKQVFSGKSPVSNVSADNKLLAQTQAEMQSMREQNAKLYGKVEELSYAIDKLTEQLKLMSEDFDFRLNDLEQGKTSNKNTKDKPTATRSVLKAPSVKKISTVVIPENITAEKLYEKAYGYLTLTEYRKSHEWFAEFIKRFPNHKLTDNAYYWVGEINLVLNDPKGAILSFSKGLKNFPDGRKAPANLLKIGVAFKQMGNVKHAKNSWNKLIKDFPNTPEAKKAKKFLNEL
ncbi:MAG: tol-pal system protein YbgF [Proteobacteria bacterium]|nr:tol-pal system protein YbgF [Pseudomonadota bacterium]